MKIDYPVTSAVEAYIAVDVANEVNPDWLARVTVLIDAASKATVEIGQADGETVTFSREQFQRIAKVVSAAWVVADAAETFGRA